MASLLARQMPLRPCLTSLPKKSLVVPGVAQVVAFHATTRRQILPPLPREFNQSWVMVVLCMYANG